MPEARFYEDLDKNGLSCRRHPKGTALNCLKLFRLRVCFLIAFTDKQNIRSARDIDPKSMEYWVLYHALLEHGVYRPQKRLWGRFCEQRPHVSGSGYDHWGLWKEFKTNYYNFKPSMKTVDSHQFQNKRAVIRVDFNVPPEWSFWR